jgi:hypothetical protein
MASHVPPGQARPGGRTTVRRSVLELGRTGQVAADLLQVSPAMSAQHGPGPGAAGRQHQHQGLAGRELALVEARRPIRDAGLDQRATDLGGHGGLGLVVRERPQADPVDPRRHQ